MLQIKLLHDVELFSTLVMTAAHLILFHQVTLPKYSLNLNSILAKIVNGFYTFKLNLQDLARLLPVFLYQSARLRNHRPPMAEIHHII